MSEHDAALAFDRFHRGEGALAAATAGTARAGRAATGPRRRAAASACPSSQAIATAHGGHADLASAPGKGTTVRAVDPRRHLAHPMANNP